MKYIYFIDILLLTMYIKSTICPNCLFMCIIKHAALQAIVNTTE